MDPDKRIVPEKHVSYLLEEDTISERTIEVKKLLHESPKKLHHVAHNWMGHSGLNPLARVIIHHAPSLPKKQHTQYKHIDTHHHNISHHTEKSVSNHRHSGTDTHATHGHTHSPSHHEVIKSDHSHGHDILHTHDNHGHGHDIAHHGHGGHTRGHDDGGHHDEHHGHGSNHHGNGHGSHHASVFSGFVSTGHWFGDQGAYIFSMVGRFLGEVIGYLLKALAVAMIFGPTRTALLVVLLGVVINITMGATLPLGISASIAGIIHLIFTSINKIGGHGGGHSEGGHSGHGGGHEHH